MVNARLQPEKLLSIYRKISNKVFQEHKPKQSGCSFLILSKWDVHNIQIDFRRYLLNASQKNALMTCTCVLLSPVFSLLFHLYIYLLWTNKLSRDYLIFLYRSFWLSNGTGRVLLHWWKFERSIRSHGTVQYFCSIQTELRNSAKFQLLSVVLPSPLTQSADLANSKWRLPAEFPRINAPTPLLYNDLHGFQGSSYLAPPQKRLLNREQHFPLFYSRGERPINSFKSNIY